LQEVYGLIKIITVKIFYYSTKSKYPFNSFSLRFLLKTCQINILRLKKVFVLNIWLNFIFLQNIFVLIWWINLLKIKI